MPRRDLEPDKLGTVSVKDGVVKWTPKSSTSDDDAAVIRDSIRELNKRVRAGELKVNSTGRVTIKNRGQ
jgi:hypothetical protein